MNFKQWLYENFNASAVYVNTPRGKEEYSVPKLAQWAAKNTRPTPVSIDWLKKNIANSSGSGYQSLLSLPEEGSEEYLRAMRSDTNFPIIIIKEQGETWIADGNHRVMKVRLSNPDKNDSMITLPAYIIDAAALPDPQQI